MRRLPALLFSLFDSTSQVSLLARVLNLSQGLYLVIKLEQVRVAISGIIERARPHSGIGRFSGQLLVDRQRLLILFSLELIDRGLTQVGVFAQFVISRIIGDLAILGQRLAVILLIEIKVRYVEPDAAAIGLVYRQYILVLGDRLVRVPQLCTRFSL